MSHKIELMKRGWQYVETQAGIDMYKQPTLEPDGVIWPDLFVDEKINSVDCKSCVNGIVDTYGIDELISYTKPSIVTSFNNPPIPIRSMDWSAWLDGQEEGKVGQGSTEEEALEDLLEQLYA